MNTCQQTQINELIVCACCLLQMQHALAAMRSALYTYPALKPLCIYHKYQRTFAGPPVGSLVPNLGLALPDQPGQCKFLLDCFQSPQHELLVLFAGSYS